MTVRPGSQWPRLRPGRPTSRRRSTAEDKRFASDSRSLKNERALLELTRSEVRRVSKLATNSLGSKSAVDVARQAEERQAMAVWARELAVDEHTSRRAQLEAQLAKERALADRAALDLSRTAIVAPFSGRVAEVNVSVGDRVRPGDPLASVFDTSQLEVRSQIPLRYLNQIQAASAHGVSVHATADLDGRPITLTLDRLSAAVRENSGGADALFRVVGSSEHLQLGRIVSLGLTLPAEADVVALPYGSVYGANRIFIVGEGDRLTGVQVERVGERRAADGGREVLVRSPALEAGARVLVTQLPNAVDGLKVKARE